MAITVYNISSRRGRPFVSFGLHVREFRSTQNGMKLYEIAGDLMLKRSAILFLSERIS